MKKIAKELLLTYVLTLIITLTITGLFLPTILNKLIKGLL